jgi:hypothetical protein
MGMCICWMGKPKVVMVADGFAGWECSHRWKKREEEASNGEESGVPLYLRGAAVAGGDQLCC